MEVVCTCTREFWGMCRAIGLSEVVYGCAVVSSCDRHGAIAAAWRPRIHIGIWQRCGGMLDLRSCIHWWWVRLPLSIERVLGPLGRQSCIGW
jgi:hypothetical protein